MEYHFTPLDAHGAEFMCVCISSRLCELSVCACLKMCHVCLCLCVCVFVCVSECVNEGGGWGSVNRESNLSGTGGHI